MQLQRLVPLQKEETNSNKQEKKPELSLQSHIDVFLHVQGPSTTDHEEGKFQEASLWHGHMVSEEAKK